MSVGKKRRWIAVSAAAVAAALGASERAQAGSFFWEGDNNSSWNTNSGLFGSNWSSQLTLNNDPLALPGANDDVFFSGLGAPSGPINTTLGQNFSIRSLTYLASNTDTVSIDGSIVNSLTIGSGGISIFGGALGGNQITANVVVGANQTWSNNVPNTVFFLGGVVSGSNALTTAGPGTFVFTGANTLSGGLTASTAGNAITFALASGSALNLSSLALNNNAVLNLDSTAGNHATQNRLADNLTINSSGGIINLLGSAATATTETVGTLQLNTGATQVNVTGAAGSTMTFGSAAIPSIARTIGGTVNFNPAPGTFINLPNVAVTNGIIGGHATVGSIAGPFGSQVDWATLDGSKNVVAFNNANYVTTLSTPTAADNVQLSSLTQLNVGSNTTINSLYLTQSGGITFQNGSNSTETLIIGSGGIISNGATPTANVNGNTPQQNTVIIGNQAGDANGFNHGFITSGTNELIITAANGSGVRIASTIKDNGAPVNVTINGNGLVDFGDGNAQANKTVNTYSGITTVNGATLVVNNEGQFGTAPGTFRANEITLNGGTIVTTAGFAFNAMRGITVGAAGGTLRYTGGSTWTLAAAITGPGGVTFSALPTSTAGGGDTVVVNQASGANTYQGPTIFEVGKNPFMPNVGSVQLGQNNALPANTALTVTQAGGQGTAFGNVNFNGKTLTVGSLAGNAPIINHNGSFTLGQNGLSTEYTGVISGSGSITKVGGGTQKFSGNNTYSGATTINGGTLLVNGSPTGTGAFTVGSAGTLGGNGFIAAPVTVNGALAPATDPNTPSNLTIRNNLTLANAASLNYLFGSPGNNDMATVDGAGKTLLLQGGATTDVLNINDLASFSNGSYTLLQAINGATFTDNANFVINGTTAFNYALTATQGLNGSLVLTVSTGNPTIAWTGAVNNNWNLSTANWSGNSAWADTDNAVFDDTGINTNIAVVAGGVLPNTIKFNNGTVPYSFSGGPITVAGSLTKNQSGAVTFNDIVTAGLVKINGGTVTVGATGALNSSSLSVVSGATLNVAGSLSSSTALQNDGTTTFTNAAQSLTVLNGGASGIVNLNGPTILTLIGGNYAGAMNGSGGLILNAPAGQSVSLGAINYTGATKIISGALVSTGNIGAGAAIQVGDIAGTNSSAMLAGGPVVIARDVLVAAGNTGTNTLGGNSADTSTFSGKITLANINAPTQFVAAQDGTVNYTGSFTGAGGVNVIGPGATVFGGTSIAYTGPTTVNGGSLSVNSASLTSSITVAGGGVYNANAPQSAGVGPIAINASTVSPGNGNTYNANPGVFNANSPNLLGGLSLTVNGGVLGINAGNTTPITSVVAGNNSTVNIAATTPVIFATASSLQVPNSNLVFSAGNAAPSSVNVKMTTADHVAGSLTNLSLNNTALQAKAGAIADLSDFNINVAPSVYTAGLREGLLSNPASDVNLNSADPVSRVGPTQSSPVQANVATNWPLNSTYTYSGQIFVKDTNGNGTGTIGFAESFDDSAKVIIDGVNVLNDEVYNVTTAGTTTLTAGWHNIEMRFGQGGGGVGPVADATNGWGPGFNGLGFGYAANGTSGLSGANYLIPIETGSNGASAVLFRTATSGGGILNIDDAATMLVGGVSGEPPAVNFGAGTNGSILAFAAHTTPVNSVLGALAANTGSTATLDVRANNAVTAQSLNVAGTMSVMGAGQLTIVTPINVQGTLNVNTNIDAPSINVAGPATNTSALLNFASGVSYSNAVNVNGAGLATISGTSSALANLITGPINLSKTGGLVLMVAEQPTGSPVNVNQYDGRVNVIGGTADSSVDGILQVRYSGTNSVIAVGLFTNVHLADNSGLNVGLAPGAANPRSQIVVDLTMDGTSGFLSSNSDGSSPQFIRNISGSNPGSLLTVFPISGTNVPNINSVNGTAFTAVGAKSINFIGSLNPNIHVLNSETAPSGINLTSNANVTGVGTTNIASFSLNGGTFETGNYTNSFGTSFGTTTLVATAASPGTSGTFLITGNGTFNVNRSADATITYQSGTLNIGADQILTGFNVGDGTNSAFFNSPAFNITTGTFNVLSNSSVSATSNTLTAGPTRIDGTLNLFGGTVVTGTLTGTGQINMAVDPGLTTGDANSGTFDGAINGTSALTKVGAGVWTVSGVNNTYTGATIVNAGTLKVTGSIVTSSSVTVNDGFFEAGASQTVNILVLANTGNAKITTSAHPGATPNVLTLNNLIIASATSSVDMTNNAMILENTNPTDVRALLISGRHGGAWNGPGINSSTAAATPNTRAVGYADASVLLPGGTTWLGQPIDSTSVLVRSTINGDANLDGAVGFADLVAVAQHYGTLGTATWITGDFNYDGNVDFADLVAVAQNYNGALPADAIPSASAAFPSDMAAAFSSVPEPGSLGFMALAGLAALRRRRRR